MKNRLKGNIVLFILLCLICDLNAQHLTKNMNSQIVTMTSYEGSNYIFSTGFSDPVIIGDSSFNLGCYATILKIDDIMNVEDHICIKDTFNTSPNFNSGFGIPGAKLDMESDIHSENLFITGTFYTPTIIGNDTLYPATPSGIDAIFLAKLDTNLNPIWAISNDFHNDWFSPEIGVKEMEVDGRGRVWLSVEVDYLNSIAFGNDTIYGVGTVVFDTAGVPVPAYYNDPEISDYEFTHMKRIDESRMLLLKKDLSVFTQYIIMMDTDADTILWKKPNYDDIRKIAVDTANNCYYGTTYNGVLYKYDMMGNRIWYNIFNLNAKPKALSLTEDGDRLFVAAVNQDTMNTIYVIDSSGVSIDSTAWGINTSYGNSHDIYLKSFEGDGDYLKTTFESDDDTLLFGNDTLPPFAIDYLILSFININQILTSVPKIPDLNPSAKALEIFPNPNKGSFQIKDMERIENIQLYNNLGQLVREVEIADGNIHIEGKAGIYFLKVMYENGEVAFGKVVKQ